MESLCLRATLPADLEEVITMATDAFSAVAVRFGLSEPDLGSPEQIAECLSHLINQSFVAYVPATNEIIGFNAFETVGPFAAAVGPIVVKPSSDGRGVGKRLMERILESIRSDKGTLPISTTYTALFTLAIAAIATIRLTANCHQSYAQALYISVGFEVKMHMALLCGTWACNDTWHGKDLLRLQDDKSAGFRQMRPEDVDDCCALCAEAMGFEQRELIMKAVEDAEEKTKQKAFAFVPYVVYETQSNSILAYTTGNYLNLYRRNLPPPPGNRTAQWWALNRTTPRRHCIPALPYISSFPRVRRRW